MTGDVINSLFEMFGGLMVFNHCRVVWRDKAVAGVSIISTVFFTAWGFWNLYYYPSLNQWWSFIGGIVIVIMNVIWVSLMLRYRKSRNTSNQEEMSCCQSHEHDCAIALNGRHACSCNIELNDMRKILEKAAMNGTVRLTIGACNKRCELMYFLQSDHIDRRDKGGTLDEVLKKCADDLEREI
jgi:hypothetical protein